MLGIKDLGTKAGEAEFESYRRSAERYIRSQIISPNPAEDAIELSQETATRVYQKLSKEENFKVNAGYFIQTAKFVLLEYQRGQSRSRKVFEAPYDDEQEAEQPVDSKRQVTVFTEAEKRITINDCLLECFSKCKPDDQKLLFRYSFDKGHSLEIDDTEDHAGIFYTLIESIREIGRKFASLQDSQPPFTKNARLKVCRLRKVLRECVAGCMERKAGFS